MYWSLTCKLQVLDLSKTHPSAYTKGCSCATEA